MAIERIIGIDFGTSTSVIKVKTYKDGKPMDAAEMADFVRFNNKDTLPSLIYLTEQGDYLIGYDAENPSVPGTRYQNFKLDMIHPDFAIRGQALMLIKLFFKYIYEIYEDQKTIFPACDIETTYVSYPAKWPNDLCQTMMSIAAEAGFQNVHGMDEPTAAIHAMLIQKGEALKAQKLVQYGVPTNMLMIDMGAGTTDLVLCRYTPGEEEEIEFRGTWPKTGSDVLLGGREVDIALCSYVKEYLIKCEIPNLNHFDQNYLNSCKSWKEANVSPLLRDNKKIKYCGFADAILNMFNIDVQFPEIDRSRFQELLSDYLKQLPALINECITEFEEINKENIDLVILTGGHSQWYFVNEILTGQLTDFGTVDIPRLKSEPQRIIKLSCPQETVALGLVYKEPAVSLPPTITGPSSANITLGYTALSIPGFVVEGCPSPKVTVVNGGNLITWNDISNSLDIAAGLREGIYRINLEVCDNINPEVPFLFTLTVNSPSPPPPPPPPPPPLKKTYKNLFWVIALSLDFILSFFCIYIAGFGHAADEPIVAIIFFLVINSILGAIGFIQMKREKARQIPVQQPEPQYPSPPLKKSRKKLFWVIALALDFILSFFCIYIAGLRHGADERIVVITFFLVINFILGAIGFIQMKREKARQIPVQQPEPLPPLKKSRKKLFWIIALALDFILLLVGIANIGASHTDELVVLIPCSLVIFFILGTIGFIQMKRKKARQIPVQHPEPQHPPVRTSEQQSADPDLSENRNWRD